MATPLRFRRSKAHWTEGRVRAEIYRALDQNLGAEMSTPWYSQPDGYDARRFEMDNGDVALFCWNDDGGYWLGNTETPKTLWGTDKETFDEAPAPVSEWAQRELLAQLYEEDPWLESAPKLAWFFLPVFLSKDGRESTRVFFREHAAGFPDADRETALAFYEEFLETGALDEYRYVMASKLGTSESVHHSRMAAAMSEFTVAKLLFEQGYEVTPEIEISTGHSIDFRIDREDTETALVEVTRPVPPDHRTADSAVAAIRQTAANKTTGQLQEHGGGVTLFVDCSSFTDEEWAEIARNRPDVGHRPAVVFRARPDGRLDGYTHGSVPIDLPDGIA
ncbi:DUF5784 family protein [Halapricum desulfuricans]|uniref:Uncharacterized protein n=1 Tax=Halapricum desulfuricans TaxID=2841257 RepID=A0A897MX51_9EURY|nr:DUF5784 family protein [Halapricum desulfuricans]QSG06700.1 Uncharacterized protein HSR121_2379 [Halapricum desulfuricans]